MIRIFWTSRIEVYLTINAADVLLLTVVTKNTDANTY